MPPYTVQYSQRTVYTVCAHRMRAAATSDMCRDVFYIGFFGESERDTHSQYAVLPCYTPVLSSGFTEG